MSPGLSLTRQQAKRLHATTPRACAACLLQSLLPTISPPSRSLHTPSLRQTPTPRRPRSRTVPHLSLPRRNTATLASSTAINPPLNVPNELRDLHRRLRQLQENAGSYVDLARLQLAIKSLESDSPVIRVALLGLGANGALAARKLARVLLSDPLSDEEAWETQLLDSAKDNRTLLLRYGDEEDVVQNSALVQNMNVPSPFLRRHNVEILVTTLNANGQTAKETDTLELEKAILVPSLTIPISEGQRVGFVRYPVHKSLVVAEGISGAIEWGRFPKRLAEGPLISAALSVPLHGSAVAASAEEAVTSNAVDIDLATHALQLFRQDRANGVQFSSEWRTSRVSSLGDWVGGGKSTAGMSPVLKDYVYSVVDATADSVRTNETRLAQDAQDGGVAEVKRVEMQMEIANWAANAHEDLQMNLAAALDSKVWRRTAWFRLLWRIDDVSVSASDVLRSSWLTEAEQTLAFLSGRVVETGLASSAELREVAATPVEMKVTMESAQSIEEAQQENEARAAEVLKSRELLVKVQQEKGINSLFDPPWPHTIHLNRQHMLHNLVPGLHRNAQGLLMSTLSTIGGSAALGGWLYVATSGIALYEAGAILTFGLAWSLRRLQKLWGRERETFANTLKEDGRRVLSEVEGQLRKIAHQGGRGVVSAEDTSRLQLAQRAITLCRETLQQVK